MNVVSPLSGDSAHRPEPRIGFKSGSLAMEPQTGRVLWAAAGQGRQRQDTTKTEAGQRNLPLPRFTYLGQRSMIFSSTAGTFRDPNNFNNRALHDA